MIELGALGWPNGLELSPETIRRRLEEQGKLHRTARVGVTAWWEGGAMTPKTRSSET